MAQSIGLQTGLKEVHLSFLINRGVAGPSWVWLT